MFQRACFPSSCSNDAQLSGLGIQEQSFVGKVNILSIPISTPTLTTRFHPLISVSLGRFQLVRSTMVQILDRISRLFRRAEYHQDYQPFRPPNVATGASLNYQDDTPSDASSLQMILVVVGVAVSLLFLMERYVRCTRSCFEYECSAILS